MKEGGREGVKEGGKESESGFGEEGAVQNNWLPNSSDCSNGLFQLEIV